MILGCDRLTAFNFKVDDLEDGVIVLRGILALTRAAAELGRLQQHPVVNMTASSRK